jgi:hypothetical protein
MRSAHVLVQIIHPFEMFFPAFRVLARFVLAIEALTFPMLSGHMPFQAFRVLKAGCAALSAAFEWTRLEFARRF